MRKIKLQTFEKKIKIKIHEVMKSYCMCSIENENDDHDHAIDHDN